MRKALRHRPSAALIVACLALFVALGGVGYAAATINGKNIVKGTITAKQVKDRSLGTKDLSKKSVKALKGQKGAKGDTGPQGVQGIQGAPGAPGSAVAYAFVNSRRQRSTRRARRTSRRRTSSPTVASTDSAACPSSRRTSR